MNKQITISSPRVATSVAASLLLMLGLFISYGAQATAPRIAPQLFGEEKAVDVVAYQVGSADAATKNENLLTIDLLIAAFAAAGKQPVVDVLPSRQLAVYKLARHEVAALVGEHQDLTEQERSRYRVITFHVRTREAEEVPVALFFSKKHARGAELHQAFNAGLGKIIANGTYLKVLEKYQGKGNVPAGYLNRLKRYNPGQK